jgi:hypothetical protein
VSLRTQDMFRKIKAKQKAKDAQEAQEAKQRERSKLERAKRTLRARGYCVFEEIISGGKRNRFTAGLRRGLSRRELIALAERISGRREGLASG